MTAFEHRPFPDRRASPWLHLFRAGELACGWPQLAVSFLAVVIFLAGSWLLNWLSPAGSVSQKVCLPPPSLVWLQQSESAGTAVVVSPRQALFESVQAGIWPWNSLYQPLKRLTWESAAEGRSQSRFGLLSALAWTVAVWSLFGTALCRAVAAQVATDHSQSLPECLRYAGRRWFSAVGATVIPATAILFLALGLIVAAWLGRLPVIGTPLAALLSPLLMIAGLMVAFFLFVILLGWPLMIAALGTESCDAFGALSRSYSYLTGRPLLALWQVFLSAVFGGLLLTIAATILTVGLMFLSQTIAGPIGSPERWHLVMTGAHHTARLLLTTFAVSLFWSLATINYLLLRQAVDQKPLDEISPGAEAAPSQPEFPLVGIAASDYREEASASPLPTDAG